LRLRLHQACPASLARIEDGAVFMVTVALSGRIPRVGLASGSARSRRPGFGPRVRASRSWDA